MIEHVPTSTVLQGLSDDAPADHFTVRWLLLRLHRHGFGIVILLLALVGMVPGICALAAVLLLIPAIQMIAGQDVPTFPGRLADRPVPTRYLVAAVSRANRILVHVEKAVHPRWRVPPDISKRIVGVAVMLMAILLLEPIPMIQIIPASVIAALALAYIEDDGLLLGVGLAGAVALSAAAVMAIWEIALGVDWIGKLF